MPGEGSRASTVCERIEGASAIVERGADRGEDQGAIEGRDT